MFYHHQPCKSSHSPTTTCYLKYISDEFDSELAVEDDSKPLTQDELKAKVIKLVCMQYYEASHNKIVHMQIARREVAMPRKIGTAGTVSSTGSTSKGSERRRK